MNEGDLRGLLREHAVPDPVGAERRAWRLVKAYSRKPKGATVGRRGMPRRRAVQLAVAAVLLTTAISPAGAAIRGWVGDVVQTKPSRRMPALTSLPTAGRLLVDSPRGAWLVDRDGSKRLLGAYAHPTWSPHGLFVAATAGHQLLALDLTGEVRWALSRPGPIQSPVWSFDGYRIAYLSGGALRVVAGDGSGDRLIATRIAHVEPAWAPGPGHRLSFIDSGRRIRTMQIDDGRLISSYAAPPETFSLSWSRDGHWFLVAAKRVLQLRRAGGGLVWRRRAPRGTRFTGAALSSSGEVAASLTRGGGAESSLLRFAPDGSRRELFAGLGRLGAPLYSPNGRWLLLPWRSADQWLFFDPERPHTVISVADISAQFDPGTTSPPAFPVAAGWCCP